MSLEELTSIHTITHQRETNTRGVTGAAVRTWTSLGDKVCRIQPITVREDTPFKRESLNYDHVAYFSTDPQADERDRFLFGSRTLEVMGTRNFDEVDELWRVELQEITAKK